MDRKLRKILTECIRDIETGARDVEGCLQRHPARAAELRPHLELWSDLNAASRAEPNFGSQQRGQQQLLATLGDMERSGGERHMIPTFLAPVAAKVAAVVAAAALLAGGGAGASAALGGPNVADEVLSTIGITSDHGDGAAEDTLDTVNENTPEEADFGLDTAEDAADDGLNIAEDHAADEAEDGLDTAEDAVDDGLNIAEDHADDEAEDGLNTADEAPGQADGAGDASEEHIPDDVPPVSDLVPDDAPIPDSVPVGPTP